MSSVLPANLKKKLLAIFALITLHSALGWAGLAVTSDNSCVEGIGGSNWSQNFAAGVDVSNYQTVSNWSQFKNGDGLSFVFIKATEGRALLNPDFRSDWADILTKGSGEPVARGAYHFYHPKDDALAQARYFVDTVGTLQSTDMPPVLDVESFDDLNIKDASVRANIAKGILSWLQYVEQQTHRVPIVYTNPGFWQTLGSVDAAFAHYPLFLADYDAKTCPRIMAPWTNWTFWQYSATGTENGVQNHIDMDIFNGSSQDLQTFISESSSN